MKIIVGHRMIPVDLTQPKEKDQETKGITMSYFSPWQFIAHSMIFMAGEAAKAINRIAGFADSQF